MGFDMGNLRMNSSWYVSLILGLLACFVYQCQAEVAPVASVIGNAVKSEVRTHGLLNAPGKHGTATQVGPVQKPVEKVDMGFIHAFVASLSVIIVSELGDKTFFIAAIMAMRHSRLTVFLGAIAALAIMTVLSAVLGYATTVIPRTLTYYASSALFALFGLKMLKEGWAMSDDEGQEEYEEVQADLRKRDDEMDKLDPITQDLETGVIMGGRRGRYILGVISKIFIQALTLTFLAEWGDRSQIATIILGAREDVIGVILGGILGHSLCTGLAVLGGRFIAQRISVKRVTLIGGVVFLIFSISAFFIDPDA